MCVSADLGPLRGSIMSFWDRRQCKLFGTELWADYYDQGILAQNSSARLFRQEEGREELKRVVASILHNHDEGMETIIPSDGRSGIFYSEREDGVLEHVCVRLWDEESKHGRDHSVLCTPLGGHRHGRGDIVFFRG